MLRALVSLLVVLTFNVFAEVGQVVLNLEPNKENPRNSEGAFVTLKEGRILFLYTQFYGGARDESPARIAAVHSDDKGLSWSAPVIAVENDGKQNVMSVSLLRLASGKIALLYLVKNGLHDCRPVICFSTDDAKTWSKPRHLTETPDHFVVNNDRLIQLSTGRLIVPAAWHNNTGGKFNNHAIDRFFYSDDEGQTWKESAARIDIPASIGSGLQEPGVVELENGTIYGWARTSAGAQYGFLSKDQGLTWSDAAPTEMKSPLSPASIKRFDKGKLLNIYNDHSGAFEFVKGKRTPLISALSTDDGKTWTNKKLLESDKDGWYCYTAIHFVEDHVLLAYCAGNPKVGGLNRLRIRRVKRAELE
ncbi:MAG TPA: sialidase family protein [Planctomycetota bacterium]|nr:sialidase family protein [Planctomycetota bacterium]